LVRFSPDILLVDHMPHGAMGELLPALEALRSLAIPTKIVLGLRDILDAPEVVQQRWSTEGAYDAVERYYDRVLVYGMRDVYDVAEQYQFSPLITSQLRYCGYVCSTEKPQAAERIRARYLAGSPDGTRLIVGMAGGGADAYPIMRNLVDSMPTLQTRGRYVLVLITGPFMPADQLANLQKRARHAPVRIFPSVEDTLS